MYGLNMYLTNRNRVLKRKIKAKTPKKHFSFFLEPVCWDIILIYPLLVIFLVNPLSSHCFPSLFPIVWTSWEIWSTRDPLIPLSFFKKKITTFLSFPSFIFILLFFEGQVRTVIPSHNVDFLFISKNN